MVVGFPTGAVPTFVKIVESVHALEEGVDEIDLVINIGELQAGNIAYVEEEIRSVVGAIEGSGCALKVILESAVLDRTTLISGCKAAVAAGADFVKTSTGLHHAGGADPETVAAMRKAVGSSFGVKASGGIRDIVVAQQMIDAGANRLGLSATKNLLSRLAKY